MAETPQLNRSLGPWQAASVVVGTIIGTGIFLKTASMTQLLGSRTAVLAAWVVSGLLSYAGALTYAELSSRHPASGGEYAFLREAYGRLPAFLYGWMRLLVGSPGSIAAYAVGSATFAAGLGLFDPARVPGGLPAVGVGLIAAFTLLNCLQVSWGARAQTFLTALKCALILGLVAAIALLGQAPAGPAEAAPLTDRSWLSAFGLAMIAALWAFDGWNNLPMLGEEVREPQRNLPLALALGVLAVLGLYLAANWAYFHVLSAAEIQGGSSTANPGALPVATLAARSIFGAAGVPLLSAAFVVSALGAMNGSILSGARVPFAMARDGLFFGAFAKIAPNAHVPARAVLLQGCVASLLALSGTFDQLTDWVVACAWTFYAVCISTLFVFRRRSPGAPFRVPGYPLLPALFILAAALLVGNALWNDPKAALAGALLVLAGLPVYLFLRRA